MIFSWHFPIDLWWIPSQFPDSCQIPNISRFTRLVSVSFLSHVAIFQLRHHHMMMMMISDKWVTDRSRPWRHCCCSSSSVRQELSKLRQQIRLILEQPCHAVINLCLCHCRHWRRISLDNTNHRQTDKQAQEPWGKAKVMVTKPRPQWQGQGQMTKFQGQEIKSAAFIIENTYTQLAEILLLLVEQSFMARTRNRQVYVVTLDHSTTLWLHNDSWFL